MPSTSSPKTIYLKDYKPFDWIIPTVSLVFDLDFKITTLTATLEIEARCPNHVCPLVLDGEEIELLSVKVNGNVLTKENYALTDTHLTLSHLPPKATVEITTQFSPEKNFSMEGLYQSGNILCTQMEAEGYRKITYYPDRPDVMSVYTVTLKGNTTTFPLLLSNGNCIHQETHGDMQTVTWHDPFPKPCYLFAIVAGDLACLKGEHVTPSGRNIDLRIYTDHDKADRAQYALDCLKSAMVWDEQTFGLECDLDTYMIVAVDAFNAGAMENKGLNIFTAAYALANPNTATDNDFAGVDSVIAHEYFHNWTGNRITCRDWFQLTLKEGLTVLRDALYSEDMNHPQIERIQAVQGLRNHQFVEDSGPLAHPIRPESYIEIDNFYTSTVYEKGAEVIRMLRTLLGKEKFRKGMDQYFESHDGCAVTTEDFIASLERANHIDLSRFQRWYSQAGTPEVQVEESFDAVGKTYTLTLSQSCRPTAESAHKKPFPMPVVMGLFDAETCKEIHTETLLFQEEKTSFEFQVKSSQKPIVSLFRNFSAPINLKFDQPFSEKIFLAEHDTDLFNRYEAIQSTMKAHLLSVIQGKATPFSNDIKKLWQTLLQRSIDGKDLPAWTALAIVPPTTSILAAECLPIDYIHIYQMRSNFLNFLCEGNDALFEKLIAQNDTQHLSYAPTFEQVSMRKLYATALGFLARVNSEKAIPVIAERFDSTTQMTDKMNTLSLLVENRSSFTEKALSDFYQTWQKDSLVINKWFSVQMSIQTPHILERIAMLEKDPCFNSKLPAKIRSLYGAFIGNAPLFHQAPSEHYPFILHKILEIDSFNAMLASGLFKSAFSQFKKLPESNQKEIQNLLNQMDMTQLSPNLFEVVNQIK